MSADMDRSTSLFIHDLVDVQNERVHGKYENNRYKRVALAKAPFSSEVWRWDPIDVDGIVDAFDTCHNP